MAGNLYTLLVVCAFVGLSAAGNCSYDYCKGELSSCAKVKNETLCTRTGQLYISYKSSSFSLGREYRCCNWRLSDLSSKYLYCVTKIRTLTQICEDGSKDGYVMKIKSKSDCNKFSCFNRK